MRIKPLPIADAVPTRKWSVALLVLASLVWLAEPVRAQSTSPAPCSSLEHRQFDFWVGEWEVRTAEGELAGTNRISRDYGGCVLHEQYDTGRGYSGSSFNIYDASREVWHQTWVDTSGLLLLLEGGLVDDRMVLEGGTTDAAGKASRQRITWTPNSDGSVEQLWQSTDATGAWVVAFQGLYLRIAPDD